MPLLHCCCCPLAIVVAKIYLRKINLDFQNYCTNTFVIFVEINYQNCGWNSNHDIRLSVIAFVTKPLNFQPPKKLCNNFLGYSGPYFGPTNTNHTKNYQKITFGALFRIPPKMHYSALQCSAMYWSANAWIIHSRWVK